MLEVVLFTIKFNQYGALVRASIKRCVPCKVVSHVKLINTMRTYVYLIVDVNKIMRFGNH